MSAARLVDTHYALLLLVTREYDHKLSVGEVSLEALPLGRSLTIQNNLRECEGRNHVLLF